MSRTFSWSLVASALVVGAFGAVGTVMARRVTLPGRPAYLLAKADEDSVLVEKRPETLLTGDYGLWFDDGRGYAGIGRILDENPLPGFVRRKLIHQNCPLPAGDFLGQWTGHSPGLPEELNRDWQEALVPLDGGVTAPAWLLPADGATDAGTTWAIHVQGIRTSRSVALRTVPAAAELGYTSLVVSFRGSGDGPPTSASSELGQSEWHDVDAAIGFALDNGAESIVLFGWSMGAGISLLTAERSVHRHAIRALVLVAPATNWTEIIRAGARKAQVPQALASAATLILRAPGLHRLAGTRTPINFHALDWTAFTRITVPTLILHSNGDQDIPLELSERTSNANPGTVTLVELESAPHAWEYNRSPRVFTNAITDWLRAHS